MVFTLSKALTSEMVESPFEEKNNIYVGEIQRQNFHHFYKYMIPFHHILNPPFPHRWFFQL